MNRYEDNISPGPSMHTSCFTTPNINTMTLNSQYWYATPPSESEDTFKIDDSNSEKSKNSSERISSRTKRRSRTTFSKLQLDTLEYTFQKSQYPDIKLVDELSAQLFLSTERISIWFQNRRARLKKARKLQAQQNGNISFKNASNFLTVEPNKHESMIRNFSFSTQAYDLYPSCQANYYFNNNGSVQNQAYYFPTNSNYSY